MVGMKSDQLVEEIIMQMAADSGCLFEKISAKNIRIRPHEKDAEVSRTTMRVHASELQALKGFVTLLTERSDRIFMFEAEGARVYEYEAFQRRIRAHQRTGTLSLIIFL